MKHLKRIAWSTIPLLALSLAGCSSRSPTQAGPETVAIGGEDYPVVVAAGRSWTARNYRGPGGVPYRGNEDRLDYGRYYTYPEVLAIPLPTGWRIPTIDDYKALAKSQGVVFTGDNATSQEAVGRLVSTTLWTNVQGTNASGFNAYPAGYCFPGQDPLPGDIAEFWAEGAISFSILESASSRPHRIAFYQSADQPYRFNARFVKDE